MDSVTAALAAGAATGSVSGSLVAWLLVRTRAVRPKDDRAPAIVPNLSVDIDSVAFRRADEREIPEPADLVADKFRLGLVLRSRRQARFGRR